MPDLRTYHAKRDLTRSPEPAGSGGAVHALPPAAWRTMVVQEHHARRRHWDLRLEIDGVLASWAVPKGPSLDPQHRRLAVRTEDHPLAYADFEGVIPAGSYGAGAMIVWDRGRYRSADGRSPAEGLAAGKLDLELAGEKLRGRFALVQTRAEAGRQWLLLCKEAATKGPPIVDAAPASVLSGLTARELASSLSRDAALTALARNAGAPRTPIAVTKLRPMLASRSDHPFSNPAWIFELKYDGARVLVSRHGDVVRLVARSGRDVTEVYPEVTLAAAHLPLHAYILDGEIAALDEIGRPSFERLQRRFTLSDSRVVERERRETPVTFFAFDLLAAAGYDLRAIPLLVRKQMLARFVPARGLIRLVEHVAGEGEVLYEWACQHDLEGIVAKRADSPYETGVRSAAWRKVKRPRTALLRIVGMLPGRGSRARLGALLLAGYRGKDLVYAGKVGSGLREQDLDRLHKALAQRRERAPSFSGAPMPPVQGTVYARPELACEVRFTELTAAGLLRQPVLVRLVDDAPPASCRHPRGEPPGCDPGGTGATAASPSARAHPPREDLLAGRGVHQGRPPRVLRGGLAVARALSPRPAYCLDTLPRRYRGEVLLPEERTRARARLGTARRN